MSAEVGQPFNDIQGKGTPSLAVGFRWSETLSDDPGFVRVSRDHYSNGYEYVVRLGDGVDINRYESRINASVPLARRYAGQRSETEPDGELVTVYTWWIPEG